MLALLGVAWLGLADLNVAGANQAQPKAKEQKSLAVWQTESLRHALGHGCKAVALWRPQLRSRAASDCLRRTRRLAGISVLPRSLRLGDWRTFLDFAFRAWYSLLHCFRCSVHEGPDIVVYATPSFQPSRIDTRAIVKKSRLEPSRFDIRAIVKKNRLEPSRFDIRAIVKKTRLEPSRIATRPPPGSPQSPGRHRHRACASSTWANLCLQA